MKKVLGLVFITGSIYFLTLSQSKRKRLADIVSRIINSVFEVVAGLLKAEIKGG